MPGDPKPKDKPKEQPKPEPPKEKVAEEKRGAKAAEQKDLLGRLAYRDVDTEEKTTVSETFTTAHFYMKVGANPLHTIQQMDDPEKRRKKLQKRVKARPDAEEIPAGAKKAEGDLIISKALSLNLRGKIA